MPNVFVAAVRLVFFHRNGNTALFKIRDFGFAAVHIPLGVAPCGNDFYFGSEGLYRQLEADLIVALTRCAVANRDGLFFTRGFCQNFPDKRPCCRRSQKVAVFINGLGFECRENIIFHVFFARIDDDALFCTRVEGTFFYIVPVFFLTDVYAQRDNFVIEIFHKPGNNDRRIQTAGIRKNDFFFIHNNCLFMHKYTLYISFLYNLYKRIIHVFFRIPFRCCRG